MKKLFLTTAIVFAFSGPVVAGDGHEHKDEKDKVHQHKEHKCEKCKKSEKNCKCDDKHKHDEDHKNEATESK